MADTTSKSFWTDASKKTATWAAVATLASVAIDWLQDLGEQEGPGLEPHHWWAIALATSLRAVVALVQGKIGDPDKASFAKSDPDVPDGAADGSD